MRSALGLQLDRMAILAEDSEGRPIPRRKRNPGEIPVKETRNYQPRVEADIIEQEDRDALAFKREQRLARLDAHERRIWELRHWDGLGQEEIAQRIGRT